jgi:hypothetical protein
MKITVKPLNEYAKELLIKNKRNFQGYGRVGVTVIQLADSLNIVFPDKLMGLPIGKFLDKDDYEIKVHKMCANIGLTRTDYEVIVR